MCSAQLNCSHKASSARSSPFQDLDSQLSLRSNTPGPREAGRLNPEHGVPLGRERQTLRECRGFGFGAQMCQALWVSSYRHGPLSRLSSPSVTPSPLLVVSPTASRSNQLRGLHISNIANVAQYSSIKVPCQRLLKMRWIVVIAVIDFNNQAVKLQCCAFLLLSYLWGLTRAEILFSFE